jgi:nucleoside transporter
MTINIKIRLSIMMFFQYLVWGAWYVTLGTWLSGSLHFSGQQIGWAAGSTAIGAVLSPFFVGLIADRLFATQKMLAALHLVGAVLLFFASRQSEFTPLYLLLLLYCFCFMPTLALSNSLAFRQMQNPEKEFSPIRVLGTIGWIVAGLFVGGLKLESTAVPMQIAAAASLLLAVYCWTLPDTPSVASSQRITLGSIIPKEAFGLLKDRSLAIFAIASLLICIPLQFYYAFTNLFLNQVGVSNAAGKMTGGQGSELFFMLLIPWFFRRLGIKYMLAVGMFAWLLRYLFFAYGASGHPMGLLWAGILMHGVCYDFFFVTGQIYVDQKAPEGLRGAAQGMITLLTYGLGMLIGSWVSGSVVDHYALAASGGPGHNWRAIWVFASVFSGVVLLLFLATFSEKPKPIPHGLEDTRTAAAHAN